MAIYKAKLESNYAVIPNALLQDKQLSYEATGLLAMMLSLPDDWEIRKSWLQGQKVKCGRDKLTSMMKELVEAGYVRRQVKQGDDGRLDGVDWLVYPEPTVLLKNRNTDKPSDGKSDTTKETDIQSKQDTKDYIDQLFEKFWSAGMRKVNKAGAKKSFNAQVKKYEGTPEQFTEMLIEDVKNRIGKQYGFDSLHPTTYLNGQRWSDELKNTKPTNNINSIGTDFTPPEGWS